MKSKHKGFFLKSNICLFQLENAVMETLGVNSAVIMCSDLVSTVKVTSGHTEWIFTQNGTAEKTTCVSPVGGRDVQFKMSNYTFHLRKTSWKRHSFLQINAFLLWGHRWSSKEKCIYCSLSLPRSIPIAHVCHVNLQLDLTISDSKI